MTQRLSSKDGRGQMAESPLQKSPGGAAAQLQGAPCPPHGGPRGGYGPQEPPWAWITVVTVGEPEIRREPLERARASGSQSWEHR